MPMDLGHGNFSANLQVTGGNKKRKKVTFRGSFLGDWPRGKITKICERNTSCRGDNRVHQTGESAMFDEGNG